MADARITWETLSADVLIVGGGFGGLWAALRAAECGSSVILVDKSFPGKSGHSYFAVGGAMALLPGDDLGAYVLDITVGNEWLVEQDMVAAVFEGSYARLKDLESLGIVFRKRGTEYIRSKTRGTQHVKNVWPENGSAAEQVTALRNAALSRGVRCIDHVYISDLVRDGDGNIAGAVGMGVHRPGTYLFQARSVILATNSGSFRGHHLACELQGTGPFMAYEAGARIKNPEFHYINIRPARHEIEGSGVLPIMGGRWVNGKGEHFMEAYDPVLKDRAPSSKIVVAAALEALKGNTPISMDVQGMTEEERAQFRTLMVSHGWQPIMFEKCKQEEGYDILRDNIEWKPAYEVNKLGIDADITCRTSLPGLFAAGMARTLGINPFGGWSIAACTWSGYTAGESAHCHAQESRQVGIDSAYAANRWHRFLAPRAREPGVHPDKLVRELQKILFPANVLIIMSAPRLRNALGRVVALREEQVPRLSASDTRTLIKARETETMVLAAEMSLRAALMRNETRQNIFYREDFPEPDNENWLKWIFVQKGADGGMLFTTEEVPFTRYQFRPERPSMQR